MEVFKYGSQKLTVGKLVDIASKKVELYWTIRREQE